MENNSIKQAIYYTNQTALDPNRSIERIAVFNSSGVLINPGAKGDTGAAGADAVVDIATTATAIGTAEKTVSTDEPASGQMITIKFTNGNSAETPTVAFAGGTARAIKLGGTAVTAAKCTIAANGVALFYFDGTVLHQIGVYS